MSVTTIQFIVIGGLCFYQGIILTMNHYDRRELRVLRADGKVSQPVPTSSMMQLLQASDKVKAKTGTILDDDDELAPDWLAEATATRVLKNQSKKTKVKKA